MRFGHLLMLAGSFGPLAASACGTEAETPACDEFPELYDVTNESERRQARAAIARAAADGCLSVPASFEDGEGGTSSGGEAGTSGAAGSDIVGGAASDGGTSGDGAAGDGGTSGDDGASGARP